MNNTEDAFSDILSSIAIPPSRNRSLDEFRDILHEKASLIKKAEVFTNKLQIDNKSLKDELSSLDKERIQVKKNVTKSKEDNAALTTKISKLKTEIKDLEYRINKKKQVPCVSEKEREILKQNEVELHAYKACTGIRWNFDVPENVLEGLITNSQKNFVKAFQFETSLPNKKIQESLWKLIKEAGSEPWQDQDEDKENKAKSELA